MSRAKATEYVHCIDESRTLSSNVHSESEKLLVACNSLLPITDQMVLEYGITTVTDFYAIFIYNLHCSRPHLNA